MKPLDPKNYSDMMYQVSRSWVADNHNRDSLVLQSAVNLEFLEITGHIEVFNKSDHPVNPEDVERYRPFVRWIYEQTQIELRKQGIIKPVQLYHGFTKDTGLVQPLMSFTDNYEIALSYGSANCDRLSLTNYEVLDEVIPPEMIFLWYKSPYWYAKEKDNEYIIIGRKDSKK